MFEQFNGQARAAIITSQSLARSLRDDHQVGTQHLLFSLARPGTIAGLALADVGLEWAEVAGAVHERLGFGVMGSSSSGRRGGGTTLPPGHIPFSPVMERVLENSLREAAELQHDYVGPGHLLLTLLGEPEATACQILADLIGNLSGLLSAARHRLATEPPTEAETRQSDSEITAAGLGHGDGIDHRPPRPATSTESAQWMVDRTDPAHPQWVTGAVGSGFDAYARLLHPLDDKPGSQTWASIAAANGRAIHPSVEWKGIGAKNPLDVPRGWPGSPSRGLPTWALEALCAILARHTSTPESSYFALSEHSNPLASRSITYRYAREVQTPGPAPVEWQLDPTAPTYTHKISLHKQETHYLKYYLYEGHVGDAVKIGHWPDDRRFYPQTPDSYWPTDHAWRARTLSLSDSTIIGGSHQLIDELCTSETLEVLQIPPDASYQDRVNI